MYAALVRGAYSVESGPAQKRELRGGPTVMPEHGTFGPARNGAEGQKDVVVHVFVVLSADVCSLVLEEPREAPQRIPPRCRESDDHLPSAVVGAAGLAIVVFARYANTTTDLCTSAGSDGGSDDNDAQVLAVRARGAQTLAEKADKIVGVIAGTVFENERGIGRTHNARARSPTQKPRWLRPS